MTADLRHLRAFLAIADAGTVTHAAARLGVGQPTLSRRLSQLEDHLGVQLVDRSTHHLALTSEGRSFLDKAATAVAAVDDALDPARIRYWPVRLGHSWSALGRYTTPLLRRWKAAHPETPLELLRIDERMAGLLGGRADAALIRGEIPDAAPVRRAWLLDEARVAAVPTGGELARAADALTLDDLADETVVLNSVSGLTTLALWPAEHRPASTVRVANTDDWLGAIAAGGAVGVSTDATAELHHHPGVVYRPLAGAPPVPVHLVWRTGPGHPAVPELVRLARAVLPECARQPLPGR